MFMLEVRGIEYRRGRGGGMGGKVFHALGKGIEKGETQNECVSLSVAETQWGVKKAAHTHGGLANNG